LNGKIYGPASDVKERNKKPVIKNYKFLYF